MDKQMKWMNGQVERQTGRQINRNIDRWIDRWRQTDTEIDKMR